MEYNNLIAQLREFCLSRLEHYLQKRGNAPDISKFELSEKLKTPFSEFIQKHQFNKKESLLLGLAFIPYLDPNFYTSIIESVLPEGGDLPIFGCAKGKNHRGILPTGETAMFLIGGVDIKSRIEVQHLFKESELIKKDILYLSDVERGEPQMSGRLCLNESIVDSLLTGHEMLPEFSRDFPAQKIQTTVDWKSLVLSEEVMNQIEELKVWIKFNPYIMKEWEMEKKLKPGYKVLFHGPSGTGKTLTASLLGKYTDRPVFRVNVSTIVSKYIGETEKNLEKLFKKAENKNWILFFDEADALFGKRTEVSDAHDRYANQEVSYLLQRVEDFSGLIILSTNFKSNMDEAFIRRFNSIIKFPFPDAGMREKLWEEAFPKQVKFSKEVNFKKIAATYKLTGGNIINAVHMALLKTASEKSNVVNLESISLGIKREEEKSGKVFTSIN